MVLDGLTTDRRTAPRAVDPRRRPGDARRPAVRLQGRRLRHLPGPGHRGRGRHAPQLRARARRGRRRVRAHLPEPPASATESRWTSTHEPLTRSTRPGRCGTDDPASRALGHGAAGARPRPGGGRDDRAPRHGQRLRRLPRRAGRRAGRQRLRPGLQLPRLQTVAAGFDVAFLEPAHEGDVLVATAEERALRGRSGIYDVTVRRDETVIAEFRGRSRLDGVVALRQALHRLVVRRPGTVGGAATVLRSIPVNPPEATVQQTRNKPTHAPPGRCRPGTAQRRPGWCEPLMAVLSARCRLGDQNGVPGHCRPPDAQAARRAEGAVRATWRARVGPPWTTSSAPRRTWCRRRVPGRRPVRAPAGPGAPEALGDHEQRGLPNRLDVTLVKRGDRWLLGAERPPGAKGSVEDRRSARGSAARSRSATRAT